MMSSLWAGATLKGVMNKPIISLFGPGVKTEFWLRLYRSLISNTIPFELILVGDRQPNFELPPNFHFIYSQVKPAQCLEIGSRYAAGDLIMPIADDVVFSNGALDSVYALHKSLNNDKSFIGTRSILGGVDMSESMGHYQEEDPSSPMTAVCPLIKKDLWRALGGVDRRFIAVCSDTDILMRIYEIGGEGILSKDAFAEENNDGAIDRGLRLYTEYGVPLDRPLLDSFWVKDGVVVKNRLSPVEPFTDNILSISQGNKGRW